MATGNDAMAWQLWQQGYSYCDSEDTVARVQWQGYGSKATAARLQQQGYGSKGMAERAWWQGHDNSNNNDLMVKTTRMMVW